MIDSDSLSAGATAVAAIATSVAAWYTAKSANRNADMVAEMRAARQPSVFIDLEIAQASQVVVLVGNSGDAPARAIRFDIDDKIPWEDERDIRPGQLPAFRDGIPYLAPGRV